MITFELPLPPSINNSLIRFSHRKTIMTRECRKWRRDAIILLRKQAIEYGFVKLTGKVRIERNFTFPDFRRRDESNYVKHLDDAIVDAGLIDDDSMIWIAHNTKNIEKGIAKVNFILSEIGS